MRNHRIQKTLVCITALIFIYTAFLPTVHSQLGMTLSTQSQPIAINQNIVQEKINTIMQSYEAMVPKTSTPTVPSPLDSNPPNVHLPPNQVTMRVYSSTTSYFRTRLFDVPNGYEVSNKNYTGWCTDSDHTISYNTAYQVTLYSSYNSSLPDHLYHQNWSRVNYIVNHKMKCSWQQVQYAILYILDFGNQGLNTEGWAMVNNAIAYGGDYVPGGGDIIAIIADAGLTVQRTIFELTVPTYTLTININGQGTVIKDPDQPVYTYGEVVQLTAEPDLGWSFSLWGGDLAGSTNPTTISLTGNKTVSATFTQCLYTLTVSVDPVGGGSVGVDPVGPYYYGDVVTLSAVASPGFGFDYWSGDASGSDPVTTVVMTGDKSVVAHFSQDVYTLSVVVDPVGGGSVGVDPVGPYYYGDVVTLSAVASPGFSFDHWSGDASGTDQETTVTMDTNKSVIAHFTENQYTLTIQIEGQGTVLRDPDQEAYAFGTVVELTAVPASEWVFKNWGGDLSGDNNPAQITMDGNKTVTAYFEFTGNDTIPPLIDLITPTNAIYIFNKFIIPFKTPVIVQMITFEVNATDHETGIHHVEFLVDGISIGNDTSKPYTYDWRELRCGKHTIQMKAYDNAGNTATTEELLVFKWRLHPILIVPILILGYLWARENP